MANKIHVILFKRRLPVDPRHNSKIERPHLAKWAAQQLSGPRSHSQRTCPVAESSPPAAACSATAAVTVVRDAPVTRVTAGSTYEHVRTTRPPLPDQA
jgi:hypothetical protein